MRDSSLTMITTASLDDSSGGPGVAAATERRGDGTVLAEICRKRLDIRG